MADPRGFLTTAREVESTERRRQFLCKFDRVRGGHVVRHIELDNQRGRALLRPTLRRTFGPQRAEY